MIVFAIFWLTAFSAVAVFRYRSKNAIARELPSEELTQVCIQQLSFSSSPCEWGSDSCSIPSPIYFCVSELLPMSLFASNVANENCWASADSRCVLWTAICC